MKNSVSLLLVFLCLLALASNPVDAAWKKSSKDSSAKAAVDVDDEEDTATDIAVEDEDSVTTSDVTTEIDTTSNGDVVEVNPDYDPDAFDSDDDDGYDSDDEDDIVLVSHDGQPVSAKKSIAVALRRTRKRTRKAVKFAKKYRSEITLGLTVFAFRREIRDTLIHLTKKTFIDPRTGKVSLKRLHPTSVLKLVLFVDFMRRLQGKSRAGPNDDQTRNALAMFGKTNPLLASIFNKVLHLPMYNPAFIPSIQQHYTFERINERYIKDGLALHKALHANQDSGVLKWPTSDISLSQPVSSKGNLTEVSSSSSTTDTVIILDLTKLDQSVTSMDQIRDQISFLLSQYRSVATTVGKSSMDVTEQQNTTSNSEEEEPKTIEVICLVESPGGSAADYGLAAQQLLRLRNTPGIKLTVCVDKVAASGGYMLACTGETVLAAPFAVVGSIGVLGQIVNVHELLEGWGISPIVLRGGQDKAPLGVIGEVTSEGKAKVQSMIDDTHRAFQKHVLMARPMIKISKVGNGDVWLGQDALSLGLIDRIATSDEYISERIASGARVLRMLKCHKLRFPFSRNPESVSIGTSSFRPSLLSAGASSLGESLGSLLKGASDYLLGGSSRLPNAKLVAPLVDSPKMGGVQ